MNELIASLSEMDKLSIASELKKLFILQDRPSGPEKVAEIVQELSIRNLPAGAIINGIRKLKAEDLRSIKLSHLIDAANEFITIETPENKSCRLCMSGLVILKDKEGHNFSLGCVCSEGGVRTKAMGLARWNGEEIQVRNGRTLEFACKDLLNEK